jgi:hypothetical protein
LILRATLTRELFDYQIELRYAACFLGKGAEAAWDRVAIMLIATAAGVRAVDVLPAQNLKELLAHADDAFVECAYATILNRVPDDVGLTHYIQRLLSGYTKMDILRWLYDSDEARLARVKIPWLERAILRSRLLRVALLGLKPQMFARRRQLQVMQRLYALEKALLSTSQQVTLDLRRFGEQLATSEVAAPTNSTDTSAPEAPTIITDNVLFGKSIVAKRIYKELTESISSQNAFPVGSAARAPRL